MLQVICMFGFCLIDGMQAVSFNHNRPKYYFFPFFPTKKGVKKWAKSFSAVLPSSWDRKIESWWKKVRHSIWDWWFRWWWDMVHHHAWIGGEGHSLHKRRIWWWWDIIVQQVDLSRDMLKFKMVNLEGVVWKGLQYFSPSCSHGSSLSAVQIVICLPRWESHNSTRWGLTV